MSTLSKLSIDVNAGGKAPTILYTAEGFSPYVNEGVIRLACFEFDENNRQNTRVQTIAQNSLSIFAENLVPHDENYSEEQMVKLSAKLKELKSKPSKEYSWSLTDLANSEMNEYEYPLKPIHEHLTLKDLSLLLGREPTADELLNVHLNKWPLDTKICEEEKIPILYLINLKKLKQPNPPNIRLNQAVTLEELKAHLKWDRLPTPQEQLAFFLEGQLDPRYKVSDLYRINLQANRDLVTQPTMEEVAKYFKSPLSVQDHFNVLREAKRGTPVRVNEVEKKLGRSLTLYELCNWTQTETI